MHNNLKDFHEKDTPTSDHFATAYDNRLDEGGNVEAHITKITELFQRFLPMVMI